MFGKQALLCPCYQVLLVYQSCSEYWSNIEDRLISILAFRLLCTIEEKELLF